MTSRRQLILSIPAAALVLVATRTAGPVGVIGTPSDAAQEITGTTASTVTELVIDPATRYTFTVTPRNPVSSGHPTAATMTTVTSRTPTRIASLPRSRMLRIGRSPGLKWRR